MLTPDQIKDLRFKYNLSKPDPIPTPSFTQDASQDVSETFDALGNTINRGAERVQEVQNAQKSGQGILSSTFQAIGAGASTAARAIGDVVLGAGKAVLPQTAEDKVSQAFTSVAKPIAESSPVQSVVSKYQALKETNPELARNIEATLGIGELAATLYGGATSKGIAEVTAQATTKAARSATEALSGITNVGSLGIKEAASRAIDPASIMQRVARIPAGKQAAFEKTAKESVGQYLVNRGVFGNVDQITEQLAKRFINSRDTADRALASLDGTFKAKPIETALDELFARETRVSSPGALSPDFKRVRELRNKYQITGLTMSENNEVKRMFERNVRVDYVKSRNTEGVARATNIDSAIREWQFDTADKLGLKNLAEINRETRLAKQLMDDLGAAYSGQSGNNAITLTDWIVLSGGDPTAAAAFLTKKAASSKTVMSKVAEFVSGGAKQTEPFPIKSNLNFIDSYGDWINSIEGQTKLPQQRAPGTIQSKSSTQSTTGDEAFGALGGVSVDDEGNLQVNPLGAALGVGAVGATKRMKGAVSSPGTKSSKLSTDTNTSTSNALTGRGDVSAQKTNTSGPFEGDFRDELEKTLKTNADPDFSPRFYLDTVAEKTAGFKPSFLEKIESSNGVRRIGTIGDAIAFPELKEKFSQETLDTPVYSMAANSKAAARAFTEDVNNLSIGIQSANVFSQSRAQTLWEEIIHIEQAVKRRKPDLSQTYDRRPHEITAKKGAAFYTRRGIEIAQKAVDDYRSPSPSIPKELSSLAEEAKKYKTAEEFVKKYNDIRHFTKNDIAELRTQAQSLGGVKSVTGPSKGFYRVTFNGSNDIQMVSQKHIEEWGVNNLNDLERFYSEVYSKE